MNMLQLRSGEFVIVTKDDGSTFETKTRSEPWKLGGHTWVIQLEGIAGCYALDRIERKDDRRWKADEAQP